MNQVNMFDVNFDNYDFMDLLEYIDKTIKERNQSYILTCNVDHVIKLRKDKEFRAVYSEAGAVVADGMPLIWASKMLGKPLKQKVSGSDLFSRLGDAFEQRKYRLFFLGSAEGVPERATKNLKAAYPGMNIVGCYSPSYGFEHNEEENQRIIQMLTETQPDIVFVGVGAPKQENGSTGITPHTGRRFPSAWERLLISSLAPSNGRRTLCRKQGLNGSGV